MFKNYLRIAWRNLLKQRAFSLINISGLAIGLTACILIFLFVQDEIGYDRFHENVDRIYRVLNERQADGKVLSRAATPPGYAPTMKNEFPEVMEAVRFFDMGKRLFEHANQRFLEENFLLADSNVFKVFSFRLLAGDPNTALTNPASLVISQKIAQKYFGDENPLGQVLKLQAHHDFQITGVMADLPENSHLKIDFLGAFATLYTFESAERLQNFIWQQFFTYLLLPENYDSKILEAKFPAFIEKFAEPQTSQYGFSYQPYLQPLADVHLRSSHLQFDIAQKGDIDYVYAFSFVAVFILLIACFNFMNLSTARAVQRAREVGMRKVVGAQRAQLVRQFLCEAILLAILALAIAIGLVELALPEFNDFTGKTLALNYAGSWLAALGVLVVTLAVGVFAGSYPAFFLSRFQPIKVLKGQPILSSRETKLGLRKILVIAQFTISLILIVGTAIVIEQLHFLRNKKLGFDKEQVVVFPLRGDEMALNYEAIKNELLSRSAITSATAFYGTPGGGIAGDDIRLPGSPTKFSTYMILLDFDYIRTFGMEVIAGREFSKEFSTDPDEAFVLNETAVKGLGWASPEEAIGKEVEWESWGSEVAFKKGRVIGVVRDFHVQSLRVEIAPVVLHIFEPAYSSIAVKIQPDDIPGTLDHLEKVWGKWAPAWPFEYAFLDQNLDAQYRSEEKLGQIFGVFSFIAIFIACLGLFGLASFTAQQRTKEIGIRKVLGATVAGIVGLLSRDLIKLVVIASFIAAPVAYFAMTSWLDNFAYRISVSADMFLLAGVLTLGIAFFTVSYQAIRAALANPIDSLKCE